MLMGERQAREDGRIVFVEELKNVQLRTSYLEAGRTSVYSVDLEAMQVLLL
jgi:hypothetical protein